MKAGAIPDRLLDLNRSNISGYDQDGTPIKGNPSEFFGLGIVAFLDLLGFSSSILSHWGAGESSPLAKLFRIRDIPLVKEELGVSIGSYDVDQNGKVSYEDLYKVRVHTLSDSVALSVALPEELTLGDFVLAFSCVALNIRFIWGAALSEGYVIRGAAEIDQIFWSERELVGPALASAYWLESTCAKRARVILGPKLLNHLAHTSERDAYDWTSLVRRSDDGLISFDPQVHTTRTAELISLRNKVADDTEKVSKYQELIDLEDHPVQLSVPAIEELRLAAKQLTAAESKR